MKNLSQHITESFRIDEATHDNSIIHKIVATTDKNKIKQFREILLNAKWDDAEIDDAIAKRKEIFDKENQPKLDKEELNALYKIKPSKLTYDQALRLHELEKQFGVKPKKWNEREYNKLIKEFASNGGAENAHDMVDSIKATEPSVIEYVRQMIRKNYGDETPEERIQWDIEAHIK